MSYVSYQYGSYRKEIRSLLDKRLRLRQRIRQIAERKDEAEDRLALIEGELDQLLDLARQQHKATGA